MADDDTTPYSAGAPQPGGAPRPGDRDGRRRGLVWWLLGALVVIAAIILGTVSCNSSPSSTDTGQSSSATPTYSGPTSSASAVVPPPLQPTTSVVPPPLQPTTSVVPPPLQPTTTVVPPPLNPSSQVAVPNGVNAGFRRPGGDERSDRWHGAPAPPRRCGSDRRGQPHAAAPLGLTSRCRPGAPAAVPGARRPQRAGMIRRVGRIRHALGTARSRTAVRSGALTASLSRRLGRGEGTIIGGRVTLAIDPNALRRLAAGRRVALVSGTNGKTTTSHLLAAALRTAGAVAHNATGSNMPDGAVAALAADIGTPYAVLEVDELHLAAVAEAVDPEVIVLLNLSRDQLDRGNEVRAVAAALSAALVRRPRTLVVANADDPMVVWAATQAARTVWVAAGSGWTGDTACCPRCGTVLDTTPQRWACACGLARPAAQWQVTADGAQPAGGPPIPIALRLPGTFNLGNATLAMAAAAAMGVAPEAAAGAFAAVETVGHRYAVVTRGNHELRLLLAKNPAGWTETLPLVDPAVGLLLSVNAREADGRDTSWLWDVPFEDVTSGTVVAAGERAADLGLRLSYAGVEHRTVPDPLAALDALPPGKVDVVANYTAFHALTRRLAAESGR